MLVVGDLGRRVVRGLILDGGFDDIGHAGIPFGSSAVEASIVGARSRGVSTSLDTNGFVLFGATLRLARLIPASAARPAPLTTPRGGWVSPEERRVGQEGVSACGT